MTDADYKLELFHLATQLVANDPKLRAAAEPTSDYAPKDPYGPHLAKLKATAAPEPSFETRWKQARQRELSATRVALDAEEPEPRMAAEALAPYRAPDPYTRHLEKMRREGR